MIFPYNIASKQSPLLTIYWLYPQDSDPREDLLTFTNPTSYTANFTRQVCEVLAYSEMAKTLQSQTDEDLQRMFSTDLVNKYVELLSNVSERTCNYVSAVDSAKAIDSCMQTYTIYL